MASKKRVVTTKIRDLKPAKPAKVKGGKAKTIKDLEPQATEDVQGGRRANTAQADVAKSGHDTSNAIIKHLAG